MKTKHTSRWISILIILVVLLTSCNSPAEPKLRLAASIYVGWMPWFLAAENGTLQHNAQAHNIEIEFVRGDYIETINQFAAGGVDAVVLTNIDALALLVGSGLQTDVILIGSYSHGNDAILLRPDTPIDQIDLRLGLVKFSVSHYLLDRYQQIDPAASEGIEYVNVSDSEIAAAFAAPGSDLDGVVTWNPIVLQIEDSMDGNKIFDSSSLEREIADMLVVNRKSLVEHPEFGQALLATWFDVMQEMVGPPSDKTLSDLGQLSGTDQNGYEQQLETTLLMDGPEKAVQAIQDSNLRRTMDEFVFGFIERNSLIVDPPPLPWASYIDEQKAEIHFNDGPLIQYLDAAID